MKDGSYHIVDYKTARITDRQDELFPLYEVQLNAYAFIAGRVGYAPVSGLSLLYLEPQVRVDSDEELTLSFAAVRRGVERRPERARGLLRRAQAQGLLGLERPPAGREGCEHCRQLERLMELLRLRGP